MFSCYDTQTNYVTTGKSAETAEEKARLQKEKEMKMQSIDENGRFTPGKWGVPCSICGALFWENEAKKGGRRNDPP